MKKLLRTLAAAFIGIGLSAGVAAAQTGTIGTTGPNSNNQVTHTGSKVTTVTASNSGSVSNNVRQGSYSGNAKVRHNTTGGSATSGAASNANTGSVNATMSNASAAAVATAAAAGGGSNSGTITNTGPDSNNQVMFSETNVVTYAANNSANVDNCVNQEASSGNARVSGNTTGGSATSGAASNTNTSTTTLVMNN